MEKIRSKLYFLMPSMTLYMPVWLPLLVELVAQGQVNFDGAKYRLTIDDTVSKTLEICMCQAACMGVGLVRMGCTYSVKYYNSVFVIKPGPVSFNFNQLYLARQLFSKSMCRPASNRTVPVLRSVEFLWAKKTILEGKIKSVEDNLSHMFITVCGFHENMDLAWEGLGSIMGRKVFTNGATLFAPDFERRVKNKWCATMWSVRHSIEYLSVETDKHLDLIVTQLHNLYDSLRDDLDRVNLRLYNYLVECTCCFNILI